MKVLYDFQIFEGQTVGGISRYFSELISRNPEARVSVGFSDNLYLRGIPGLGERLKPLDHHCDRFLLGARFKGKRKLFRLYSRSIGRRIPTNKSMSISAVREGDYDVFHPTYYNPYFLDYLGKKPLVLTIHDLIHEKFPELFGILDETRSFRKRLLERANAIIAISENTKKDLVSLYGIDPADVAVVYHGSSLSGAPAGKASGLPEKYILYVGSREGYKNFRFLLWAIADYLRAEKDLCLLCVGPRIDATESEAAERLGIRERLLHRYAAEDEMLSIYRGAECFVFPSYYEGFGMPILEAFEADCPAVLARASCFPEIAGDAALYFDPKDKEGLLGAIKEARGGAASRRELAQKGRKRLAEFSWDVTYRKTVDVYKGLC